ncbi:hypothetical protein HELRODRAFT_167194 [Helobdella robusta]|uniref:G-protein coupled receptors family 1 profile domain-containing protein n=1 Tax=Helobdella robusta TaxID=6412 RepID=T1EZ46_HELRO|nr:hypothetical protein HELRODRAFT_167194 [Helobdella robusta]ESO10702.1 hypothetical protein HELRODRAFT_167194 [Helobdella robusta]
MTTSETTTTAAVETSTLLKTLVYLATCYSNYHGFVSLIVCIIGTFCNAFNVIVLTRKELINSTNLFLTALALADFFTMLSYIPISLHFYCIYGPEKSPKRNTYFWAVFLIFQANFSVTAHTIAIWLAVVLSAFRYSFLKPHVASTATSAAVDGEASRKRWKRLKNTTTSAAGASASRASSLKKKLNPEESDMENKQTAQHQQLLQPQKTPAPFRSQVVWTRCGQKSKLAVAMVCVCSVIILVPNYATLRIVTEPISRAGSNGSNLEYYHLEWHRLNYSDELSDDYSYDEGEDGEDFNDTNVCNDEESSSSNNNNSNDNNDNNNNNNINNAASRKSASTNDININIIASAKTPSTDIKTISMVDFSTSANVIPTTTIPNILFSIFTASVLSFENNNNNDVVKNRDGPEKSPDDNLNESGSDDNALLRDHILKTISINNNNNNKINNYNNNNNNKNNNNSNNNTIRNVPNKKLMKRKDVRSYSDMRATTYNDENSKKKFKIKNIARYKNRTTTRKSSSNVNYDNINNSYANNNNNNIDENQFIYEVASYQRFNEEKEEDNNNNDNNSTNNNNNQTHPTNNNNDSDFDFMEFLANANFWIQALCVKLLPCFFMTVYCLLLIRMMHISNRRRNQLLFSTRNNKLNNPAAVVAATVAASAATVAATTAAANVNIIGKNDCLVKNLKKSQKFQNTDGCCCDDDEDDDDGGGGGDCRKRRKRINYDDNDVYKRDEEDGEDDAGPSRKDIFLERKISYERCHRSLLPRQSSSLKNNNNNNNNVILTKSNAGLVVVGCVVLNNSTCELLNKPKLNTNANMISNNNNNKNNHNNNNINNLNNINNIESINKITNINNTDKGDKDHVSNFEDRIDRIELEVNNSDFVLASNAKGKIGSSNNNINNNNNNSINNNNNKRKTKRKGTRNAQTKKRQQTRQKDHNRTTAMLVVIVVLFLITELPQVLTNELCCKPTN